MRFSGSVYNFRIQGEIKLVSNCSTELLGLLIESRQEFIRKLPNPTDH